MSRWAWSVIAVVLTAHAYCASASDLEQRFEEKSGIDQQTYTKIEEAYKSKGVSGLNDYIRTVPSIRNDAARAVLFLRLAADANVMTATEATGMITRISDAPGLEKSAKQLLAKDISNRKGALQELRIADAVSASGGTIIGLRVPFVSAKNGATDIDVVYRYQGKTVAVESKAVPTMASSVELNRRYLLMKEYAEKAGATPSFFFENAPAKSVQDKLRANNLAWRSGAIDITNIESIPTSREPTQPQLNNAPPLSLTPPQHTATTEIPTTPNGSSEHHAHHRSSSSDTSGGTEHVEGYTRSDGTHVEGYDRHAPSRYGKSKSAEWGLPF